jgi:hypothetical protein
VMGKSDDIKIWTPSKVIADAEVSVRPIEVPEFEAFTMA